VGAATPSGTARRSGRSKPCGAWRSPTTCRGATASPRWARRRDREDRHLQRQCGAAVRDRGPGGARRDQARPDRRDQGGARREGGRRSNTPYGHVHRGESVSSLPVQAPGEEVHVRDGAEPDQDRLGDDGSDPDAADLARPLPQGQRGLEEEEQLGAEDHQERQATPQAALGELAEPRVERREQGPSQDRDGGSLRWARGGPGGRPPPPGDRAPGSRSASRPDGRAILATGPGHPAGA
jgi:hypothetical protein